MAEQEGARKTSEAIVVSTTPDVCNTPVGATMVPVPYPIIGRFDAVTGEAPTVLFTKQEAFTTASRITTVQGNEAGSGGGVGSGVNTGYCRPTTYSSTVFAEGHQVVSHDCKMEMNCAAADGPGNTQGQVIYLQIETSVKLDDTGEIVGETNPEVAPETPEEQSLWQKASPWVHGILDFGGLVPVFGEVLDGLNALIYLGEGDKLNAGLSAAGMIPVAGWGATGAKVGIKAQKLVVKEVVEEGAEKLTKEVIEESAEKATKEVVEGGAEKITQKSAEKAEDGVHVTRKNEIPKKNKPICAALATRILNQVNEILQKRTQGLLRNVQNQFMFDPYRQRPHADDVWGHMVKFRLVQADLRRNIAKYEANKCGPLPPGAAEAAVMDIPPRNPVPRPPRKPLPLP